MRGTAACIVETKKKDRIYRIVQDCGVCARVAHASRVLAMTSRQRTFLILCTNGVILVLRKDCFGGTPKPDARDARYPDQRAIRHKLATPIRDSALQQIPEKGSWVIDANFANVQISNKSAFWRDAKTSTRDAGATNVVTETNR